MNGTPLSSRSKQTTRPTRRGAKPRRFKITGERLETRWLLAVTASLDGEAQLIVEGSGLDDSVFISIDERTDRVVVRDRATPVGTFILTELRGIRVTTHDGHDIVNLVDPTSWLDQRQITRSIDLGEGNDLAMTTHSPLTDADLAELQDFRLIMERWLPIVSQMETLSLSALGSDGSSVVDQLGSSVANAGPSLQDELDNKLTPAWQQVDQQKMTDLQLPLEQFTATVEELAGRYESLADVAGQSDQDIPDPPEDATDLPPDGAKTEAEMELQYVALLDRADQFTNLLNDVKLLVDDFELAMTTAADRLTAASQALSTQIEGLGQRAQGLATTARERAESAENRYRTLEADLMTQARSILDVFQQSLSSSVNAFNKLPTAIPIPPLPNPGCLALGNPIIGGPGFNLLFGTPSNDTIIGNTGIDILIGLAGHDVMSGFNGTDLLIGDHPNNNPIFPNDLNSWNDCLYGGPDIDLLVGDSFVDSTNTVGGNDTMYGGTVIPGADLTDLMIGDDFTDLAPSPDAGGADTMFGQDGIDLLFGTGGNDTIEGGRSADVMFGGDNDDLMYANDNSYNADGTVIPSLSLCLGAVQFGGLGNDTMLGANCIDIQVADDGADFVDGKKDIDFQFGGNGADQMFGDEGGLVPSLTVRFGNLMVGGNDNDQMTGGGDLDVMLGQADDDSMFGFSGSIIANGIDADVMLGGSGNDLMEGDNEPSILLLTSVDFMFGEGGDDTMRGGNQPDLMVGGQGNDVIDGDSNANTLLASHDFLFGDDALLSPNGGNDTMDGGMGNDFMFGEFGNDTMRGDDESFQPHITPFNDFMIGGLGDDTMNGGNFQDFMFGDNIFNVPNVGGNDTMDGDSTLFHLGQFISVDAMWGGPGNDTMNGGRATDFMFGNEGNDTMKGDLSAPIQISADLMFGNEGEDWMDGGRSIDTMFGGPDADFMLGDNGSGLMFGSLDVMKGNDDCDEMYGGDSIDFMLGDDGSDIMEGQDGWDLMAGGRGTDIMKGNAGFDAVAGNDDGDAIEGNSGADWLDGGDGNDCLTGDSGVDTILGGNGNDCIDAGSGADFVFGQDGDDQAHGRDGLDSMWGGDGNDHLLGDNGPDLVLGQDGDDRLEGGSHADVVSGGSGDDQLWGGSGPDWVNGGSGSNTNFGGTGVDAVLNPSVTQGGPNSSGIDFECRCIIDPCRFDLGDAPQTYSTLLTAGPQHGIYPVLGPFLGATVDKEPNGQPTPNATGDDVNGSSDEDGVSAAPLITGLTTSIIVTVNNIQTTAYLDAWIDFDGSGAFGAGPLGAFEQIAVSVPMNTGANVVNVTTPWAALLGAQKARFRLSTAGGLAVGGFSVDGEVEDHLLTIQRGTDWGDLPDVPYGTLSGSSGPMHFILEKGPRLGARIDHEPNGQPSLNADLDDATQLPDDEDGVGISVLTAGTTTQIPVVVSNLPPAATARLNAWIDFDGVGGFSGTEQVVSNLLITSNGTTNVNITTPLTAAPGTRYVRFRLNTTGGLTPQGIAADGEVEDYTVLIQAPGRDYGDAPHSAYDTLTPTGASHLLVPGGPVLGPTVDQDPNGQPVPAGLGDDSLGIDDEDGIVPAPGGVLTLVDGTTTTFNVLRTGAPGRLNAWVDFNGDTDFLDPGEQVATNVLLSLASTPLSIFTPLGSTSSPTFARFRLNSTGLLGPSGAANDGEVEDYRVQIEKQLDFGDANTIGQTTLPAGAHHQVTPSAPRLGSNATDFETNGTNSPAANFDDLNGATPDDEDGVTFVGPVVAGASNNLVTVILGSPPTARLDAWIDFNNDQVFTNPTEQIIVNGLLSSFTNNLTFAVPNVGVVINTPLAARFRVSTGGTPLPTGFGGLGEVEDHQVTILRKYDFGDAQTINGQTQNANPSLPTAAHHDLGGPRFGSQIDDEFNGTNSINSDFDDLNGATPDDEDGVVLPPILAIGGAYAIPVTISNATSAFVNAWIDANNDQFFVASELVTPVNFPVVGGANLVPITIPPSVLPNSVAVRFRVYATASPPQPDGYGGPGEVEDYRAVLEPLNDFGDAFPSSMLGNPQTVLPNGARHVAVGGPRLGTAIDIEPNGQPFNAIATGDDITGSPNDEDGVTVTPLTVGSTVPVTVTVTGASPSNPVLLNAWVDFNGNDQFDHPLELVANNLSLTTAVNSIPISLPGSAQAGSRAARFRVSRNPFANLPPTGPGGPGEVEDYMFTINRGDDDYGDAPASYTTLWNAVPALSGPYHAAGGPHLGTVFDVESNGVPSSNGLGDDLTASDDEDGVTILSISTNAGNVVPCMGDRTFVTLSVFLSNATNANLDAWLDLNTDGDFTDPFENIFTAQPLIAGANTLSFMVPPLSFQTIPTPPVTFSRFRVSAAGSLPHTGFGGPGEVEDHRFCIEKTPAQRPTGGFVGVAASFAELAAQYDQFLNTPGQRTTITFTGESGPVQPDRYVAEHGLRLLNLGDATYAPEGRAAFIEELDGFDDTYELDGSTVLDRPANHLAPHFMFTFDQPVQAVGSFLGTGREGAQGEVRILAFDRNGATILEYTTSVSAWNNPDNREGFWAVYSDQANIASIRIENLNPIDFGNALILDNLTFIRPVTAPTDFNGDGVLDQIDLEILRLAVVNGSPNPRFDLDGDGNLNTTDFRLFLRDSLRTDFGDADLDGQFTSSDIVHIFQAGKYEANLPATWEEGDWNADGVFSSSDFIDAFQAGWYETGPLASLVAESMATHPRKNRP